MCVCCVSHEEASEQMVHEYILMGASVLTRASSLDIQIEKSEYMRILKFINANQDLLHTQHTLTLSPKQALHVKKVTQPPTVHTQGTGPPLQRRLGYLNPAPDFQAGETFTGNSPPQAPQLPVCSLMMSLRESMRWRESLTSQGCRENTASSLSSSQAS